MWNECHNIIEQNVEWYLLDQAQVVIEQVIHSLNLNISRGDNSLRRVNQEKD